MHRKHLEKNDKTSQSYVKIHMNDYFDYGHLSSKRQG